MNGTLAGGMQIFVKTLNGKDLTLDVDIINTTVYQCKLYVQKREGIPPESQRLVYAGVELKDQDTFAFSNCQKDSTLFLVLRLQGGKQLVLTEFFDRTLAVKLMDVPGFKDALVVKEGVEQKMGDIFEKFLAKSTVEKPCFEMSYHEDKLCAALGVEGRLT
jgi:hypothetical protein